MFKITSSDLQRRSATELSSLFNHIHRGVGWLVNPSAERSAALALLALIRAEQTRRGLSP